MWLDSNQFLFIYFFFFVSFLNKKSKRKQIKVPQKYTVKKKSLKYLFLSWFHNASDFLLFYFHFVFYYYMDIFFF